MESAPTARAAALGGNTVAFPSGSGSLSDNPAGLAHEEQYLASARYQRLLEGIGRDDLGTGGLTAVVPLKGPGCFGLSWDHLGGDHLQQDRWRLSWGRQIPLKPSFGILSAGLSLSRLAQRYTLTTPLTTVDPTRLSSAAFSFGAAVLWSPFKALSFGFSGEDLTRPNLGVLGVDRLDPALRVGVALRQGLKKAGTLHVLAGFSRLSSEEDFQGGLEWAKPGKTSFSIRCGGSRRQGSAGFGMIRGPLTLDYSYQFSMGTAASLEGTGLPASHLFEAGYRWGKIIPLSPEEAGYKTLMRRAVQEEGTREWLQALWSYRRALEQKPGDPTALNGYNRTRVAYNKVRAAQYFRWGREAESRGYLLEAQRQYDWAAQLDPLDRSLQEARDRLRSLTPAQAPTGALADPRVVGWLNTSAALSAQGRRDEARQMLLKARALYPGDPALDDFEKAITAVPAPAVSQTGPDPIVDRLLAESEIYMRKGRSDLARRTWQRVLEVDPGNKNAKVKLDASGAGVASPQQATPENQARAQAFFERGLRVYLEGETKSAVEFWEKALDLDPNHENALNNLVRARLELSGYAPDGRNSGGTP